MEMYNANEDMCSTYEVMLMGMNTDQGRPQAFPDALMKRIEYYYNNNKTTISQYLGHQIGITKKPNKITTQLRI